MKKRMRTGVTLLLLFLLLLQTGCSQKNTAADNSKMSMNSNDAVNGVEETENEQGSAAASILESVQAESTAAYVPEFENAVRKGNSVYDCDLEADREAFNGKITITVGDDYYATQMNDWYMNFEEYEGKTVEIEGYYIGDFDPYDMIGRYGPSCPYCQGGYVCFEFLTDQDLSEYASGSDWIKVMGILRRGMDEEQGEFYYIEALQLTKMDECGVSTVVN